MNADGSCPTCGASLASPPVSGPDPGEPTTPVDEEVHTADDVDEDDDSGVPWHFKLLVVAARDLPRLPLRRDRHQDLHLTPTSVAADQSTSGGQVRAAVGTVTVIVARWTCFDVPVRRAHVASANIQSGRPGGRSAGGMAVRSSLTMVVP